MLSVWTDGLPSNLIAEFVGLVCSVVVTYLIVDKLIEQNRRRNHKPLKLALHRAVGQNVSAIAQLWAYELGRASVQEVEESLVADGRVDVQAAIGLIEDLIARFEHSPEARQEFLAGRKPSQIEELARETFEDITAIEEVASRVAPVIYDDIDLEKLLAELAASSRTLDHGRSFAEFLRMDESKAPPLDMLMVLAIKTYRGAQSVWVYLDKQAKEQR